MPPTPKTTAKSKGKQPKITAHLTASQRRRARRIAESSESESEDDVRVARDTGNVDSDNESVEEVAAPKPRGRPRKTPAQTVEPIFDADKYPEQKFSMYVSQAKTHVPILWFQQICDWLDANVNVHDTSTERGAKDDWLHVQSVWGGNCLADAKIIARIVGELKHVIGVRWGDKSGVKVQVKPLVVGQTLERMIGYVRKDRNLVHFNNRNKGITEQQIAEGIAEHESLTLSYIDGKALLTKANVFMKAWQYYMNYISPRVVTFSTVLAEMLNSKKYTFAASLLMNSNGQMRRSAAEVYWLLVLGREITEYEVRHIIYLPKNGFHGCEYLPNDFLAAPQHKSMFGESDDDEVEGAQEDGAPDGAPGPSGA